MNSDAPGPSPARPEDTTTTKDAALAEDSAAATIKALIAGLPVAWRLAGLTFEERLVGLKPEEVLSLLKPEERLAGLDPAHAVLALPVEVLRGLTPDYLATLPDDVQTAVRARLAAR